MKIERTKNAKNNIIFGVLLKVYQLAVPFAMRTVIIYLLGIEYLGLDSLFSSVLRVLNLAELGVGSAMVFSMYQPIAEDDTITICALMKLYRLYYRIIGAIIAVLGLILLPFIPQLISGDIPNGINVYILYLMHLASTVISYWLFAYKTSQLSAHQRTDVTSKITICTTTVQYLVQFAVLFIFHSYYLYVLTMLLTQAITNMVTAAIVNKMYPDYHPYGSLPKEYIGVINQRVRDLFTSKLGGIIVTSADSVVISIFLGLTVLAEYNNYYYIISAIIGFVAIVFNSCTAGIGNSIIVETQEKNYQDLRLFTFVISWLAGFCSCCLISLIQPFMKIWVGEQYMLGFGAVICFVSYFYIYEINQLLNLYKDAAGMWHEDRFRPLVTALTNLGLNLLLINYWGIYGVLLSTTLSMLFVGMPWLIYNLFTVVFNKGAKKYIKELVYYTVISFFVVSATCFVCNFVSVEGFSGLVIKLIICCIVSNGLYIMIYHRNEEFRSMMSLIDRMCGGKIRRIIKNK